MMNKDKLITIRIEAEKRDKFKEWARSRGLDVSEFLTTIIQACLDGQLDEKLVTSLISQPGGIRIDKLEDKVNHLISELDICIDKIKEGEKERSLFKQQLLELVKKTGTEPDQISDDQAIKSNKLKGQPDEGLTHVQLARQIGVASSTVSRWANKKRQPPKNLEWRYNSETKKWVKN